MYIQVARLLFSYSSYSWLSIQFWIKYNVIASSLYYSYRCAVEYTEWNSVCMFSIGLCNPSVQLCVSDTVHVLYVKHVMHALDDNEVLLL